MIDIDERIVEMRFDNAQFERETKRSMDTITELKKSLNMDQAAQSFQILDQAASHLSFDGITSGVEFLTKRFSTLGIVGMQIIQNLTDSLIGFAKKGISFVVDTIVSGGIKRAMNIENAHFQLQMLLKDEAEVQKVMDDAMKSVDGTAYAYDEAAKAASQFSASGIKAGEDMQSALRGIVGVAAMTNSEYESISNIFTTVAGNGRLMGDQLLQLSSRGLNAAATIADFFNKVNNGSTEASDTVKDLIHSLTGGLNTTEADIREFVTKGQISFKIFSEAMTDAFGEGAERANETFQGAFSNIKSALARIGAEFVSPLVAQNSEVINLFNAIRVKVNEFKQAITFKDEVNGMRSFSSQFTDFVLKIASGLTTAVEKFNVNQPMKVLYNLVYSAENIVAGLLSIIKPIGSAFTEAFRLNEHDVIMFVKNLKDITEQFRLSEDSSKNLHDTFKGLFDIVRLLADGFFNLIGAILPVEKPIASMGAGLLEITGNAGRSLSEFSKWVRESTLISNSYNAIRNGIEFASEKLSSFISKIREMIKSVSDFPIVEKSLNLITSAFSTIGSVGSRVGERLAPLKEILSSILDKLLNSTPSINKNIESGGNQIINFIDKLSEILDKISVSDGFSMLTDLLNSGILAALATAIIRFVNGLTKITDLPTSSFTKITDIFKEIQNVFHTISESIEKDLKANVLQKVAISIGILAASLLVLSLIDSEKLANGIAAITVLFADLFGSIYIFETLMSKNGLTSIINVGKDMITLSASVLMLAAALKQIGSIEIERLSGSVFALTLIIGELVASAVLLARYGGKIETGAINMIALSASILILSSAVKKLGGLQLEEAIQGVVSMGTVLTELIAVVYALNEVGNFKISDAIAIGILSLSLLALQKVVKGFSEIDVQGLVSGIAAIALINSSFLLLKKVDSNATIQVGISMMAISAAMLIFSKAIRNIGELDVTKTAVGLLALSGALFAMVVAVKNMPDAKNVILQASAIAMISGSLLMISEAFTKMGSLSWEELGRGMIAIAGGLTAVVLALNLTKTSGSAAVSIALISASLLLLAPALKALGSLSWSEIGIGLVALAGAFTVIGVAGMLLTEAVPGVLGIAAAIALLGVAVASAGVGILAFSAGMTALLAIGIAGAITITKVLNTLVNGITMTIVNNARSISEAVTTLIAIVCTSTLQNVPLITETIGTLLVSVLGALEEYSPQITNSILKFIIGVLNSVAENTPELVYAIANLIERLFTSINEAFGQMDIRVLLEGSKWMVLLAGFMASMAGLALIAPLSLIGIAEMGAALVALAMVLSNVGVIAQIPGLTWFITEGANLLEAIGLVLGSFIGGFLSGSMSSITKQLPDIATDLSQFMINLQPFLAAASTIHPSMFTAVNAMTTSIILLTGADILRSIGSWVTGKSSLSDFGKELASFGPYFAAFALSVSGVNPAVVAASASCIGVLADMANRLPNSGGLAQKLFGEKRLSDFGKELASFGPYFSKYAASIRGVNPAAITASASAGKILTELANAIPRTGGLVSIFGGNNSISKFGEDLEVFGKSLANYYKQIQNVDMDQLTDATEQLRNLAQLADEVKGNDTSPLSNLISGFAECGNKAVSSFANAFKNSNPTIQPAINDMVKNSTNAITKQNNTFKTAGTNSASNYIQGIKNQNGSAYSAGSTLSANAANGLPTALNSFGSSGTNSASNYIQGIKNQNGSAYSAGSTLSANVRSGLNTDTFPIGTNAGQGLIDGLNGKLDGVRNAAWGLGNALYKELKTSLKVKSPSRKLMEVGDFAGQGFIEGLVPFISAAAKVGNELANATVDSIDDGLSGWVNLSEDFGDLVIRPTIDLENVERGIDEINAMFDQSVRAGMDSLFDVVQPSNHPSGIGSGDVQYTMIQNNYSPTALSAVDIYRQTQNQLRMLKQEIR